MEEPKIVRRSLPDGRTFSSVNLDELMSDRVKWNEEPNIQWPNVASINTPNVHPVFPLPAPPISIKDDRFEDLSREIRLRKTEKKTDDLQIEVQAQSKIITELLELQKKILDMLLDKDVKIAELNKQIQEMREDMEMNQYIQAEVKDI